MFTLRFFLLCLAFNILSIHSTQAADRITSTKNYLSPNGKFLLQRDQTKDIQSQDETGFFSWRLISLPSKKVLLTSADEDGDVNGWTCLWFKDSSTFALYVYHRPRWGETIIYRLVKGNWKTIEIPVPENPMREKIQASEGRHCNCQDSFLGPVKWIDRNTLLLKWHGFFKVQVNKTEDEVENIDYDYYLTLRIDQEGQAKIIELEEINGGRERSKIR